MRYQPYIRCNIAYTPWPSAYCPPHVHLPNAFFYSFGGDFSFKSRPKLHPSVKSLL